VDEQNQLGEKQYEGTTSCIYKWDKNTLDICLTMRVRMPTFAKHTNHSA